VFPVKDSFQPIAFSGAKITLTNYAATVSLLIQTLFALFLKK
jgi:hypothetical protein